VPHQGSVTNPPSITDGAEHGPSTSAPSPVSGDTTKADEDAEVGTEEAAPTPIEVDKEKPEDSKNQTPVPSSQPTPQQPTQQQQQQGQGQGPSQQPQKDAAPQIDLLLEASKLPLDVAIFNSTRAAGGDDKIRKYLQAVLVVGGTALTPGIAHALESRYASFFLSRVLREGARMQYDKVPLCSSLIFRGFCLRFRLDLSWNGSDDRGGMGDGFSDRLQAIATPLVQNMEKVQIIPPPKDVDKRVLAWKGASVLGRMEGVTEMWVTGADWVSKERRIVFTLPPHAPLPHLEHIRNAGSKRTMLLIVSAKSREETVPCNYYADTICKRKPQRILHQEFRKLKEKNPLDFGFECMCRNVKPPTCPLS